jgi:hypothetical protein
MLKGIAPTTRTRIIRDVEANRKYKGNHGLDMEIEVIDLEGVLSISLRVCLHRRWRTLACASIVDALDKYESYIREKYRTQEVKQEGLF